MADIEKLAEDIVGLTLLEAQQLKDLLKDKYGIEPAAGGGMMMAAPAAASFCATVASSTSPASTASPSAASSTSSRGRDRPPRSIITAWSWIAKGWRRSPRWRASASM